MPVFEWEEKYHQLLQCRMVGTLCVRERERERERERRRDRQSDRDREKKKTAQSSQKLFRNNRLKENTECVSYPSIYK